VYAHPVTVSDASSASVAPPTAEILHRGNKTKHQTIGS